jgi:hypothetical protein
LFSRFFRTFFSDEVEYLQHLLQVEKTRVGDQFQLLPRDLWVMVFVLLDPLIAQDEKHVSALQIDG